MFFGHGGTDASAAKDRLLEYFFRLDATVRDIISASHLPLILAGAEELHSLYWRANKYPHLIEGGLYGNFEEASEEQLHELAWPVIEPLFTGHLRSDIQRYRETGERRLLQHSITSIVPSAYWGAIDTVFLDRTARAAGSFTPQTGVVRTDRKSITSEDLYNLAAIYTWRNRGTVHIVPQGQVPGGDGAAAICRFE